MPQFLLLIFVYALFIYGFESRIRHTIEQDKVSPFDEKILSKFSIVASFFNNKGYWSNLFLSFGTIIATALFIYALWITAPIQKQLFIGLSVTINMFAVIVAASFPGDTWIKIIRNWVEILNQKLSVQIGKRIVLETWSFLAFGIPFLFAIFISILAYINTTQSIIGVRLLFYFIPIFLVMWVYRISDYNVFKMNVRRLLIYLLVAGFILFINDPVSQLTKLASSPPIKPDFTKMFNEFSILAFIAFDRVGKVTIEILSHHE